LGYDRVWNDIVVISLREWPHKHSGDDAIVVNLTSGQWWWDIDTTALPIGKKVEFYLTTEDVNHGLGIYDPDMRLLVQVQAMPGYRNKMVYTFDRLGTYTILCMEFCGLAHNDMTYEFEDVEASS